MASTADKDLIDQATHALTSDKRHLDEDTDYYEANRRVRALGSTMPPQLQDLKAAVGWGRLYVDSINERIEILGFRTPGSTEAVSRFTDWWQINDLDEEAPIGHSETLVHGRGGVSVSSPTDEDIAYGHPADVPIFTVESPRHIWWERDRRTKRVKHMVRFTDDPSRETDEQTYTILLPNSTTSYAIDKRGNLRLIGKPIEHGLNRVPFEPMTNRASSEHPYGQSEIFNELRSAIDVATRTVMNMQAASELMAVPQRLLFGVEQDALKITGDAMAKYNAYMAGILAFENESGTAHQFSAAELNNYTIVIQELAKQVASYTGLPPQYLAFSSDNPASAEAIRSAEGRLVKKCELKGRMFGNAWERAMRLGVLIMDRNVPRELLQMQAILADPATPTYASKADAAAKLYANGMGLIPKERGRIDVGYTPEEREEMHGWDQKEMAERTAALIATSSQRFGLPSTTAAPAAG